MAQKKTTASDRAFLIECMAAARDAMHFVALSSNRLPDRLRRRARLVESGIGLILEEFTNTKQQEKIEENNNGSEA